MSLEEMERKLGEILEFLNQKADLDMQNIVIPENYDYVIESKLPTTEDPTWYRLYKSGWVEQGGQSFGLVTFLKPYRDTTYTVTASSNSASGYEQVYNPTPTSITIGQSNNKSVFWMACGQSAQ